MVDASRYLWRERVSDDKEGTRYPQIQTIQGVKCAAIGILIWQQFLSHKYIFNLTT